MSKKLIVDGTLIEVEDGTTLMHACEAAGAEIPRFCFHERLSIAGNCRMCLVDVAGSPKPLASCAVTVNELRPNADGSPNVISTKSAAVKKAREGVMEFLLINHPLDCPICDQGGECDLQDQAMAYGVGGSRYDENKRAVEDKFIGPLIKTHMTRCIHCTRCVRYMTEVAGVEELGLIGRGEDAEITTYLENGILSEMSANAVDLCPVGALTHRPWAHNARPWELKKTESIDVMDAVGSSIRVDTRGREVMRILPRNNDAVNEEWISDKTRHVADGLKTQRLDRPYVRRNGRLEPATWAEALDAVAQRLKSVNPARIGALAGDLAGAEEMFALKDLMRRLGVTSLDCRQDGAALNPTVGRASYLFNATIDGIERADAIMIIGSNPRLEAPVLNARIRKRWRQGGLLVGVIGERVDLGYPYTYLGAGPETLATFIEHAPAQKERPMFIIGMAALARPDGSAILSMAAKAALSLGVVTDDWNGFSILHTAAARVAGLDLGFVPEAGGKVAKDIASGGVDVIYNLGADEIDVAAGPFVIYQGSHGDKGAHRADVILPGAAYTEKSSTYVNTEGRAQQTLRAAFPPGDAREDWAIIRALSAEVGHTLPYDTLSALRAAMYKAHPVLARIGTVAAADARAISSLANTGGETGTQAFGRAVEDFYLTNPIARASQVMAEMSALKAAKSGAGRRDAAE
ncbi:MAG: NADH-quinone oxidoreductase subunit NuoG [Hyphomicrobium sp.]|nr:NADH-quinone oxidoreductase subunit NuoG [Hyphomicrobium sp.]